MRLSRVESADTLELVVNEENAETLGLDLSNIDLGSEEKITPSKYRRI